MNRLKQVVLLVALGGVQLYCKAQTSNNTSWKIKPLPIKTRWAKDVKPDNVLPEYPRPQMVRNNWENLNGLWQYTITAKDAPKPSAYNDLILVPFPIESGLSGVKKALLPTQKLWYRRTFSRPDTKGKQVLLHFGAVDWQATVYVNGKEIGSHQGGYQNFSFNITNALKEGENELVVGVYDPTDQGPNPHGKQVLHPKNIYYTPSSGIWQTVWMESVPTTYVNRLVMTPNIDSGFLRLSVEVNGDTRGYTVEAVSSAGTSVKGKPGDAILLSIQNARLWSPDDPYLYGLNVRLLYKGRIVDTVGSYFGMRKIEVKKDEKGVERLFLNNKFTFHLGVLDQGFWPDGLYTAPTDAALRFDIVATKNMGFNTIRKHIKLEPARWYYHADQLGMLVWQDMVTCAGDDNEAHEEFEAENAANIAQLHNYPSIVIWVLFNEGWARYDQQRLTEWLKKADPSRVVDGHTGENYDRASPKDVNDKWAASDLTDIHDYPGPGIAPYIPGKARVLGEWGGVRVPTPQHQWDQEQGWGYIQVKAAEFAHQYQFMLKHLKVYEEEGLSGSIYTEPFDVETEENGLMTYDREIIKIPAEKLRRFNSLLIPQAEKYSAAPGTFYAQIADTADPDGNYAALLQKYKKGGKDSAFLFNLAQMATRVNDKNHAREIAGDYIRQIKYPFSKTNLTFIQQYTTKSTDPGFKWFLNNAVQIDTILGEHSSAGQIMMIAFNENIDPILKQKGKDPNWDSLENLLVKKYGDPGEEIVWRAKTLHYYNNKNWNKFVIAADPYFKKYGRRVATFEINNYAFAVFTHVSDKNLLASALNWSKYTLQQEENHYYLDTYANLLYKLGQKDEAIPVEEKALTMAPKEMKPDIQATIDKMKKGQSTWQ